MAIFTWISFLIFNTLRPKQNGHHFPDDIFKYIFLNENIWILIKISLKFVPRVSINNIPALVQIMAWRRPGDKPLSEPMMDSLPTRICVTRPQWVKCLLLWAAVLRLPNLCPITQQPPNATVASLMKLFCQVLVKRHQISCWTLTSTYVCHPRTADSGILLSHITMTSGHHIQYRDDSRFAPSQWETPLLCNDVSHWPGRKPRISLAVYYIASKMGLVLWNTVN